MTPFNLLRQSLSPKGELAVVSLQFQNKYFKPAFVQKLIDELETAYLVRESGLDDEAVSALHHTVMLLLVESAGFTAETFKDAVENANVDRPDSGG